MKQKLQNLNERLKKINKTLTNDAVQYNFLVDRKKNLLEKISELTQKEKILQQASVLLQEASTYSRLKMKKDIESVVGKALRQIFEDPSMGFHIEYGSSHNKVTADFFLKKTVDGKQVQLDIMNECGGGVADVVALAIRIVLLLYHSKTVSKILMLDEACTSISNFSGEVLNNLGRWLSSISKEFSIQIILITQKSELAAFADKSFEVTMSEEGYSIIT
jgi:DNA repair exonuclease SbcCD ATPase subunit